MNGFSIKKKPSATAKQPVIAAFVDKSEEEAKRDIAKDLVIPLTANPWAGEPVKREPAAPSAASASLDEAAAAAVIAEGVGEFVKTEKPDASLVIPLDGGGGAAPRADAPLLVAAMMPGLADIEDEGDKFRHDVSRRADDITCEDAAYKAVPIEAFGVGMLRGMGWGGPTDEDEDRFKDPVEARQKGLGLGATPKPPEIYDKRGRLREGRSATSKEAAAAAQQVDLDLLRKREKERKKREKEKEGTTRAWLGAAKKDDAPAAPDAPLAAGDVVRISRPRGDKTLDADLDGRRARVVEPSDAIRPNHAVVEIEATAGSSGRELLPLPHRALARVDAASLAKKPFREPKKKRKRESDGGGGARKRASEPARPRAPPWLVVGIKVRIARDGDPRFRCKGRVLDVLMGDGGALRATLALENGDRVDEPGLREKHLETALPKDGGAVRAVLGPRKNALGTLLARDKRKEQATVRFDDDDGIDVLPFDHVAEWCGER